MPIPSNQLPPTAANSAHRNLPRLPRAGRILKILTTLIVLTFVCTYARTALRYGSARPQTTASITRPTSPPFFTPAHARAPHRRPTFFRQIHQVKRRARRPTPYYLASLRRIRRLFSQLLIVRS